MSRPKMPGDRGSHRLLTIGARSVQNRDRRYRSRATDVVSQRNSCTVDLVAGFAAQSFEELRTLCDSGRSRRVALLLQARARVNQQRTADAGDFRLDEFVGAESVGETKVLIADQLDSGEEVVDVCDMLVSPVMANA